MEGLPLYLRVRDSIRNGIEKGLIRADARGVLPSQQFFAEQYKVSLNTVKRALANLEKNGLVKSRRGKGLTLENVSNVSSWAEVSKNHILHIGIAFFRGFREAANPTANRIIEGVEDFSKKHNLGLHQVSFPGLEMKIQEDMLFSNFPFMNLDGILLLSPVSSVSIGRIKEKGMPYVSFNFISDEDAVCHVGDTVIAGFELTDAILRRGRKNIILFVGNRNKLSSHLLWSGFNMAFAKHGLKSDSRHVSYQDYDMNRALDFINGVFRSGEHIDAIMAFDDKMAAGIRDFLWSKGKNDILVTGAGNFEKYRDKIKITVEYPLREIGYNSVKTLFEMINGAKPEVRKFYYEPILIER